MKQLLTLLALVILVLQAGAHGGEDHGPARPAAHTGSRYFSAEALSDKYEVLVKYGELQGGQKATFQLFLSDAQTNRAIDSATLALKVVGQPGIPLQVSRLDTGMYQVSGIFPANKSYELQVSINSALGPDFLQVAQVEVGKKLDGPAVETPSHWYDNPWLVGTAGVLAGLLLMFVLMRRRNRRVVVAVLTIGLLVPTAVVNPGYAHDGEDHGAGSRTGGAISNTFVVEKESQFLFAIRTQKVGPGSFYQTSELLGTVTAAPQGRAVIQTPQTGKIVALRVTPGQAVLKGQLLALVQQQVDAGTQINIISQRNTLDAEVKAARAQYERLQSIADIAAKKDVTEARARYESAVQNLRLFHANVGGNLGNTKTVALTAPISGVVGTFNYAIGAVINAGETLFEITNVDRLYVETQLFSTDLNAATRNGRFQAFAGQDTTAYALRPISTAQAVNSENQAQRAIFELVQPAGKFRIGQNVRVLQFGSERIAQLVVPTAAIVDIGGKPAVFIKDHAEQFSVSFIQKRESNPLYTAVAKGIEAGERVVTGNVFQIKMIYLGQ